MIRERLKNYIYNEVIPGYAAFDKAHREDHALTVIERALSMGKQYDINEEMLLAAAEAGVELSLAGAACPVEGDDMLAVATQAITDIRERAGADALTQPLKADIDSRNIVRRERDSRWSSSVSYEGSSFEDLLGTNVTVKSNGTILSGQKVFIRAAARINYDTPRGSGTRRWNYSDIVEVDIP